MKRLITILCVFIFIGCQPSPKVIEKAKSLSQLAGGLAQTVELTLPPSATETFIPPTQTDTETPSPTATATLIPPTATNTPTPTHTATSTLIPPTRTFTSTPTSTSTATLTPVLTNTSTPTNTSKPSLTTTPTKPPPATSGDIRIEWIFYDGAGSKEPDEYVEIKNFDTNSIQIQNWTLRDIADHIYRFPAFVMEPNQVCRVYTNEIHPDFCGFSYGGPAIWNNTGDTAYLRDSPARRLMNTHIKISTSQYFFRNQEL